MCGNREERHSGSSPDLSAASQILRPSRGQAWWLSLHQPPQHVLQDAAVAVVLGLVGRVDADLGVELDRLAVGAPGADLDGAAGLERFAVELGDLDVEGLVAGEAEALRALALRELERQDAHADQVRAVDAREALRDRGPPAQERGALGGPVA